MPSIQFNPSAQRGKQFTVTLPGGQTLTGLSRDTVDALLRKSGVSVRDASVKVADAKLAALGATCS